LATLAAPKEIIMAIKKSLTKKAVGKRPAEKFVAPKGKKVNNLSASEFTISKYLDGSSPK
jgi:hypothetical protein